MRGEVLYRHSNGLFAGPTFDMVGERYADFVNSYTVDSYNLLGFRAGWDRGTWSVYAEFHNVLDENYIATMAYATWRRPTRKSSTPACRARRSSAFRRGCEPRQPADFAIALN